MKMRWENMSEARVVTDSCNCSVPLLAPEFLSQREWGTRGARLMQLQCCCLSTRVVLVTTWREKSLKNYSGGCPENLRPLQQAPQLAERKLCWGGVKLGEWPIDVAHFQASSLVMCMTILLKLIFICFSYGRDYNSLWNLSWGRRYECVVGIISRR